MGTFRIGLVKYRDMLQNAIFSSEFFFQRLLENFLCVVWPCSIYLEGCLRPYLYARKKIRVIRHIDQKILAKNRSTFRKKPVQTNFPGYHCSESWNVNMCKSDVWQASGRLKQTRILLWKSLEKSKSWKIIDFFFIRFKKSDIDAMAVKAFLERFSK